MVPKHQHNYRLHKFQWHNGSPGHSVGVALITVMMIMALMTTFAAYLIEDNHISIRRTANNRDIEAAHQLAVGGEQLAIFAIEADGFQDISRNNLVDYYGEIWTIAVKDQQGTQKRTIKPAPEPLLSNESIGDGTVSVLLTDASAKFNVNNLAIKPQQQQGANVPADFYEAFKRLLASLGIDEEFADAVVDWIDSDTTPDGLNGAEDEYYTGLDVPYRSANTPFSDIAELRLVRGFDDIEDDKQKKLLSLVSALPIGYDAGLTKTVPINLNTAPAELLTLLRTNSGTALTLQQAKTLVTFRNTAGPFRNIADFASETGRELGIQYLMPAPGQAIPAQPQNPNNPNNPNNPANPPNQANPPANPAADETIMIKRLFGLQSEYFDVETTVKYGRFDYSLKSTIRRYPPGGNSPKPSAGILRRTRHIAEQK